MNTNTFLIALERRGVDGCTGVILAVVLLVLMFAGTAGAQTVAAPAGAASCAETHEAAARDVQALRKLVTDAHATTDVVTLRAALDATLRHLDAMDAKALKCAGMMKDHMGKPPATKTEPAKTPELEPHKH